MSPFYAWPSYRDPWDCNVTDLRLDGKDGETAIDGDHLRIDAFSKSWSHMQLALHASTDEPAPAGSGPVEAIALLSCTATQLRRAYPLTAAGGENKVSGTLEIPRQTLAGKATLTVEIIGKIDGRRRVMGSTLPWSIVVAQLEAPPRHGVPPLKTAWANFADPEAPLGARRHSTAHAFLDVAPAPPILYLNKGIDGLQQLLLSDNAKNERRRQRDILGALIARYVAGTLFRSGIDQIVADQFGGPPEGPSDHILRSVCEAVAAQIPSISTTDDLYAAVIKSREGALDPAEFWTDVDLALDELTSISAVIARTCQEVKHV